MLICCFVGVTHGDVRPDHVLLHKGLVMSGGFDSSQLDCDDTDFGTKASVFCAPEVLDKQHGHLANMWSLGVSLTVLLTGRFLFITEGMLFMPLKRCKVTAIVCIPMLVIWSDDSLPIAVLLYHDLQPGGWLMFVSVC